MKWLDMFLLLVLAALGWGCAFALLGLCIHAGVPDNLPLGWVYAGFGAAAGASCTLMRAVVEQRLPVSLAAGLRRTTPVAPPSAYPTGAAFAGSAFGR